MVVGGFVSGSFSQAFVRIGESGDYNTIYSFGVIYIYSIYI